MDIFLMTLLMLLSLFMMLVVLLQRGRGGGLAGAFGGAGGQSAFGTKAGDVFTKITVGIAVVWFILSGVSGMVLRARDDSTRFDDRGRTEQAEADAEKNDPPLSPATGDSELTEDLTGDIGGTGAAGTTGPDGDDTTAADTDADGPKLPGTPSTGNPDGTTPAEAPEGAGAEKTDDDTDAQNPAGDGGAQEDGDKQDGDADDQ